MIDPLLIESVLGYRPIPAEAKNHSDIQYPSKADLQLVIEAAGAVASQVQLWQGLGLEFRIAQMQNESPDGVKEVCTSAVFLIGSIKSAVQLLEMCLLEIGVFPHGPQTPIFGWRQEVFVNLHLLRSALDALARENSILDFRYVPDGIVPNSFFQLADLRFDLVNLATWNRLVDGLRLAVAAHKPVASVAATAANITVRKSEGKGSADAKIVAALAMHHQYDDGSCLNLKPIGNNELARLSGTAKSTVSGFFKSKLGGRSKYVARCRDAGSLADDLKVLRGEMTPPEINQRLLDAAMVGNRRFDE